MRPQSIACLVCGAQATRMCGVCRTPLCERHMQPSVDAKG